MDIRIFYQDFILNALNFNNASLILKPDKAIHIWNISLDHHFTEHDAESVYIYMNSLNIPPGHRHRAIFEKAGHTSMSIGDFIWVPEKLAIWMVTTIGWRIWRTQELIKQFGEPVFNIFNGNDT